MFLISTGSVHSEVVEKREGEDDQEAQGTTQKYVFLFLLFYEQFQQQKKVDSMIAELVETLRLSMKETKKLTNSITDIDRADKMDQLMNLFKSRVPLKSCFYECF